MRTPLLAGLFAVLLPACLTGEITDLDEGAPGTGSGSGSGSGSGTSETPRVAGTLDKSMITSELGKTVMVAVNLTSEGGFAGDVTVAGRVVDEAGNAMPNVSLQGPPTVALTADGTGQAMYQIQIPMNATGSMMTGAFKVELMSTAGSVSLSSVVTINPTYTVDYAANTGATIAAHMNANSVPNLVVKRGAVLRFHNSDTATHIIHGGGAFPHEDTVNGGTTGRNYDVETIAMAPGSTGTLGCHTHGDATYSTYTVE